MCERRVSAAERREFLGLAIGAAAGPLLVGTIASAQQSPQSQAIQQPAPGANGQSLERMIADWPAKSQEAAGKMIQKYGPPNGMTPTHLVWVNNGPWKYSVLYKEETPHNFPMKHMDMLEQAIAYRVPPEMFDELAAYDGSVTVRRTKGEMSAMCDKEEMNFLAINLAHDIVTGKMSVEEARQFYGKVAMAFMKGEKHEYTQQLSFQPPEASAAADPDEPLQQQPQQQSQ